MDIYRTTGEKIKEIIKKKNISQKSLMKPLEFSKGNTSKLINGLIPMNLNQAKVLSKELQIEITINKNGVKIKDAKKLK